MIIRIAIECADDVEKMKYRVTNNMFYLKTNRCPEKEKEELFTLLQNTAKINLYNAIFSSVYEANAIKTPLINLLLKYDEQERITLLECAILVDDMGEDFEDIYTCIKHIDNLIKFKV